MGRWVWFVVLCGLSACSDNGSGAKTTNDTVFSAQTQALDKAKQAEQAVLDAQQRTNQAVDAQSQ